MLMHLEKSGLFKTANKLTNGRYECVTHLTMHSMENQNVKNITQKENRQAKVFSVISQKLVK